jgi:hypothetical protein
MDNIFIIAGVIAFVFLLAKFIEMRFVEKDNKPLKLLVRDALLVYFSVVIGYYIIEQLNPATVQNVGGGVANATPVFTNNPEF